jgi:transposase-like protein
MNSLMLSDPSKPPRSASDPDPEVPEKARRRHFTAKYKLRVLAKADGCSEPGEIGELLRKEALYSSHLSKWRQQREEGALAALTPKKRGRKPRPVDPQAKRVAAKAETIIEVQKKLFQLLESTAEASL